MGLPEPWATGFLIFNLAMLVALIAFKDDFKRAAEEREAEKHTGRPSDRGSARGSDFSAHLESRLRADPELEREYKDALERASLGLKIARLRCRECGLFWDDHHVYGDRLMGHRFKGDK